MLKSPKDSKKGNKPVKSNTKRTKQPRKAPRPSAFTPLVTDGRYSLFAIPPNMHRIKDDVHVTPEIIVRDAIIPGLMKQPENLGVYFKLVPTKESQIYNEAFQVMKDGLDPGEKLDISDAENMLFRIKHGAECECQFNFLRIIEACRS